MTESADIIVVGAGAAGCVVGARLAEDHSRSVMLVEAGPDARDALPGEFRDGWGIPQGHDWGYAAEPRFGGAPQRVRRGRLVGGTGWLTRFAPRGAPADFDRWAALGNPGWDFGTVLPYLRRIENDCDFGDRAWHGDAGPIPVTRYLDIEHTEPLQAAWEALTALGFAIVEDHNEPGAVGVGRMPMSGRAGARVTTADAYLPDHGANLTVRADTLVAEVLFEGTRATGIRCADGAVVEAGRIVLAAGVFGTPALLMRSGVGPAAHLRSVGIRTRVDLPGVGSNLADHSGFELDLGYRAAARAEPLLHVIGTFHSSSASVQDAPDLMLWLSDPVEDPPGPAWFGIEILLMRPQGRGSVRLRSADPADPPRIELPDLPGSDLDRLAEGFEVATEIAGRPEVRRMCAAEPASVPGAIRAWISRTLYSYPHVVGTCAMGPRPEDGAVVGLDGAVHGVQGVSVADASVIPDPPSGFPHLPTIVVAERVAEAVAARA